MFTDMVGYTALAQRNESLALALAEEQRKLVRPILKRHNGREIKTIGDAFLVEFPSALDGAMCAYDIQRSVAERNGSVPDERRIHLRVGVHLGDVVEEPGGDISGDAVNVASRIQALAEDGGVCITRQVYDHVQNKFELPLASLGEKNLKNVALPLEVFKMVLPWEDSKRESPAQFDRRRIAVLPFANMSPDPKDEYLADGIAEEIISTVSGISSLSVISRTSVMGYKGTTKKVRDIGRELEVGSVLEGSLRKAANRIRITAQLIDVANDRHLWAQNYDRELDDVFAVQSDIAKQVAEALRVRILSEEATRLEKKPTESTMAHQLYLEGRYHWSRRGSSPEELYKAKEYFERAVKEDPNFALGYGGIGECCELLKTNWGIDPESNHRKAAEMVGRALDLDPGLAEAHATKGLIFHVDFKLKEAEEEFKKAIALKPNYSPAHMWYFQVLVGKERWDEALKQIEEAVELDPLSQVPANNHAYYYFCKRDWGKALELYKRGQELEPSDYQIHLNFATIYGMLGRMEDMEKEGQEAVKGIQGDHPIIVQVIEALTATFKNDRARVRELLPDLEANITDYYVQPTTMAALCFYLGDNDRGFAFLERAYSTREFGLMSLRTNFLFDGIRTDPRYVDMLKKVGLV
jgi:adenylate cyclase